MRAHKLHQCGLPGCDLCNERRAVCVVCGGEESTLTTECPGVRLPPRVLEQVRAGRLNFVDGRWQAAAWGVR